MRRISLIMPYYDNPEMLSVHYHNINSFSNATKERLQLIIVDDGSPHFEAAEVGRPLNLPNLEIYRVLVDKPWHQHAARNIGAYHAKGPWLLLTDMDHLVPEETFKALFKRQNRGKVYTFTRVDAPDMKPKLHPVSGKPHSHPNSFAMSKRLYWEVGGYDEDYCGIYGTDSFFRKKLFTMADEEHLDAVLIRYSREMVSDASTTSLPRKEGRDPNAKNAVKQRKIELGTVGKPTVLSMPYKKVYPI